MLLVLVQNNSELWPSLCAAAMDIFKHKVKVGQFVIENAWIGSDQTMLSSLFVKFASSALVRSLSQYKRHLPPGNRIDDVVPPSLMELECNLQGKVYAMRIVSPQMFDSSVVRAGQSRVLQRRATNSPGASFIIVCGNPAVGNLYIPFPY